MLSTVDMKFSFPLPMKLCRYIVVIGQAFNVEVYNIVNRICLIIFVSFLSILEFQFNNIFHSNIIKLPR